MNKLKISVKADCGNSPKKAFLKDVNIAFAEADISFLLKSVSDDIRWDIIGDKAMEGKESFARELKEMSATLASELVIDKIITHGREGSVNGVMTLRGGKKYAFADVYEFANAKGDRIKSIVSYVITVDS